MPTVYIAFGSNLGDRRKNIENALQLLEQEGVSVLKCSSLMETDPVGGPAGQGKYFNGALKAQTTLSPQKLLQKLLGIEQKLGRVRTVKNAERIIDLDILLYDDVTVDEPDLKIPHPRMREREFVMQPLKEINPEFSY